MKRRIALIIVVLLSCMMTACGNGTKKSNSENSTDQIAQTSSTQGKE